MTKQFTKGCAVDVRGMSEVMFDAIKRVGEAINGSFGAYPCNTDHFQFLLIKGGEYCLGSSDIGSYLELLTPTDILGEHLVKAIKEGYKPWFEGDDFPVGRIDYVSITGTNYEGYFAENLRWSNGLIIAYKLWNAEQPSIESKVLSAKVNNHNHYFKDVSHLNTIDVYRVIDLFEVVNPCHQHALKKILCCGQRGEKDATKDTQEAIDSLNRALEMMREDDER